MIQLLKIIFLLMIISCDFTPRLHKEILIAQRYTHTQKYKRAIAQYESILRNNPPPFIKVKVYHQLGDLFSIYLSDNKKALKYYSLIKSESEDPAWLVRAEEKIGEINFSYLKDYSQSILNYKNLTEFVPPLKKIYFYQYRLALSYLKNNQMTEAIDVFNDILKKGEQTYSIKALYYLGLINYQQKNWKEAIDFWKKYIKREERKDNIVHTKFLMANAYETMEELKLAYDLYYSILGEHPNTTVVQNRLNSIYARKVARKR